MLYNGSWNLELISGTKFEKEKPGVCGVVLAAGCAWRVRAVSPLPACGASGRGALEETPILLAGIRSQRPGMPLPNMGVTRNPTPTRQPLAAWFLVASSRGAPAVAALRLCSTPRDPISTPRACEMVCLAATALIRADPISGLRPSLPGDSPALPSRTNPFTTPGFGALFGLSWLTRAVGRAPGSGI